MDIHKTRQQEATPELKGFSDFRHKAWVWSYVFLALACLASYFLLRLHVFELFGSYREMLQKFALAGFFAFCILTAGRIIEQIISKRAHYRAARYNLIRLTRLVA